MASESPSAALDAEKNRITATLIAVGSKGCSINEFENFYREDWSETVPHADLGFASTINLLKSVPDVCELSTAPNGAVTMRVVNRKETATILSLVDRTDTKSTKPETKTKPQAPVKETATNPGLLKHSEQTTHRTLSVVLRTPLQIEVHNTIYNELKSMMHITNVTNYMEKKLDINLTLEKFNELFLFEATSFEAVYQALFGDTVLVLKTGGSYRLAYVGNDGIVSRKYDDFIGYIRERRTLTFSELFNHFCVGDSKAVKAKVLSRILNVEIVANDPINGLKSGLPADLVDLSELDKAENKWDSISNCQLTWIGNARAATPAAAAKLGIQSSTHDVKQPQQSSINSTAVKQPALEAADAPNNDKAAQKASRRSRRRNNTIADKQSAVEAAYVPTPVRSEKQPSVFKTTVNETKQTPEAWKSLFLAQLRKSKQLSLYDLCNNQGQSVNLKTLNAIFGQNKGSFEELMGKVFGASVKFTGVDEPTGKRLQLHFVAEPSKKPSFTLPLKPTAVPSSSTAIIPSSKVIASTSTAVAAKPKAQVAPLPPTPSYDKTFWKAQFLDQLRKSKTINLQMLCTNLGKAHNRVLDLQTMNKIFDLKESSVRAVIAKVFPGLLSFYGTDDPAGTRTQVHFITPTPSASGTLSDPVTPVPPPRTTKDSSCQTTEIKSFEIPNRCEMADHLVSVLAAMGGIKIAVPDACKLIRNRYPRIVVSNIHKQFDLAKEIVIYSGGRLTLVYFNTLAFVELTEHQHVWNPRVARSYRIPPLTDGVTLVEPSPPLNDDHAGRGDAQCVIS